MNFTTTLLQAGKTATGFEIPPAIVESFGKGKKPPVLVTINGYTYRNTVAVMGGVYMIGVSAEHRKGAGLTAGDIITVNLELDTAPRIAEVPLEFQQLLNKSDAANKYFDRLSYSKKQGVLIPISVAKTTETKQRRMEKAIMDLAAGKI